MAVSSFCIQQLKPLKGVCSGFHTEVQKIARPYLEISEEQYKQLESGNADYYQLPDGRVVTFGNADGGWALMPLKKEFSDKILSKQ